MEKVLQGATILTITGNSNNDDDSGVNWTHGYHDKVGGVDIYDEDSTE